MNVKHAFNRLVKIRKELASLYAEERKTGVCPKSNEEINKVKTLIATLSMCALALSAWAAPETVRLDSRESAAYGASYVTVITYADLTSFTETNGTYAITSSVPAKVGLTMAGMILETPFNDDIAITASNAVTNSITLAIGDGTTSGYFMQPTQVAEDSTGVFVQFAPLGAAITKQTLTLTGTVQNVAVVTNIATSLQGQRYYPSAGSVVYSFAGSGDTVWPKLTKGKVKIYWRELK